MTVIITINTDNDSFTADGHQDTVRTHLELIKILAEFHTRVRTLSLMACNGMALRDTNGNTVGQVEVRED